MNVSDGSRVAAARTAPADSDRRRAASIGGERR
jgi:hypothetical protein